MDSDPIPPSSPPHASTANILSSPFFEPQDVAFSPKSSSPPPLFSSDDSRESVDVSNYESPRIFKNKRKGAWWDNGESAQSTPEAKKTKMTRNYDSGVYMMSDATDSSEDLRPQHKSPFPIGLDGACDEAPRMSAAQMAFNDQIRVGLERNLEVYEFRALDLEDDDIEQIGDLASVIKNPLDPGNDLPAEGQYRSMVPELYVNLNQNKLCRLTPSLFNVQCLTTLILRNNQIEELPQQIGQLENLRTLDVSLNRLKSLPFEILQLLQPYGSLERVTMIGNPLLEPMYPDRFLINSFIRSPLPSFYYLDALPLDVERDEANAQLPHLYDSLDSCSDPEQAVWRIRFFESWANSFGGGEDAREDATEEDPGFYEHHPSLELDDVSPKAPRYIARTMVSYFDQAGHRIKDSPALPSSNDERYPVIVETNRGAYGVPSSWFSPPSTSRVASLLTTSLHTAFKRRHFDNLSIEDLQEMVDDPMPPDVDSIFDRAVDNDAGGYGEFRECHVCHKDYVVARAEWVEFWSAGPGVFFPLKVSVCSWGCVPTRVAERPARELTW